MGRRSLKGEVPGASLSKGFRKVLKKGVLVMSLVSMALGDSVFLGSTFPREKYCPFSEFSPLGLKGFPCGGMSEISGPPGGGKTELVLNFLRENPSLKVAWIEDKLSIFPRAFHEMGLDLNRVLFMESGSEVSRGIWATLQVVRSQLFQVVVLSSSISRKWISKTTEVNLRRLQVAAERAQVALILLSPRPTAERRWALKLQLKVKRRVALAHGVGPFEIEYVRKEKSLVGIHALSTNVLSVDFQPKAPVLENLSGMLVKNF